MDLFQENYIRLKLDYIKESGQKVAFLRRLGLKHIPMEVFGIQHIEFLDLGASKVNNIERTTLGDLDVFTQLKLLMYEGDDKKQYEEKLRKTERESK